MIYKVILLGNLIIGALAQSGIIGTGGGSASGVAAQTTVPLAIAPGNGGWAGSIIGASACETTYAVKCTSGEIAASGVAIPCAALSEVTLMQGPGTLAITSSLDYEGAQAKVTENCKLEGTTKAECTVSVDATAPGTSSQTTLTTTFTGAAVGIQQVAITAGAFKLSKVSCNTAAAISSIEANAASPTGRSQVYKVLVAQGAAALLAGAVA